MRRVRPGVLECCRRRDRSWVVDSCLPSRRGGRRARARSRPFLRNNGGQPRRNARTARTRRLSFDDGSTSSLRKSVANAASTVRSLMKSTFATPAFERPSASSRDLDLSLCQPRQRRLELTTLHQPGDDRRVDHALAFGTRFSASTSTKGTRQAGSPELRHTGAIDAVSPAIPDLIASWHRHLEWVDHDSRQTLHHKVTRAVPIAGARYVRPPKR